MAQSLSAETRAAISSANQAFLKAFNQSDAAGCVSAVYAASSQILPPNSEIIEGTDGIQAFWQGAMDMGIKSATLDTVELEPCGDAMVEIGKYTLQVEGDQTIDEGKYLVVWKQEGTEWKWHRDIWNSSRPIPEADA